MNTEYEKLLLSPEKIKEIISSKYPCFEDDEDAHLIELEQAICEEQHLKTLNQIDDLQSKWMLEVGYTFKENHTVITFGGWLKQKALIPNPPKKE